MNVMNSALTPGTKLKYDKVYKSFMAWKAANSVNNISEDVLITYFKSLPQTLKPSSILAYYSMIKATLKVYNGIDISNYRRLLDFLKINFEGGQKPIKTSVFTKEQIKEFISTAPDSSWLDVKAICIFGVCGALSSEELTQVKVDDIEKRKNSYRFRVPRSGKRTARTVTISDDAFCNVIQKYAALRSHRTTDSRFFVNYQNGKCTAQLIGKHKVANMPQKIAAFLKLPETNSFRGTSFRLSNANCQDKNWSSIMIEDNDTQENFASSEETHCLSLDSIVSMKSEPMDRDQSDFEQNLHNEIELGEWLPADQIKTETVDDTRQMFKCEQCGHLNKIASSKPPDGFFDERQSVDNKPPVNMHPDPLSLEFLQS